MARSSLWLPPAADISSGPAPYIKWLLDQSGHEAGKRLSQEMAIAVIPFIERLRGRPNSNYEAVTAVMMACVLTLGALAEPGEEDKALKTAAGMLLGLHLMGDEGQNLAMALPQAKMP